MVVELSGKTLNSFLLGAWWSRKVHISPKRGRLPIGHSKNRLVRSWWSKNIHVFLLRGRLPTSRPWKAARIRAWWSNLCHLLPTGWLLCYHSFLESSSYTRLVVEKLSHILKVWSKNVHVFYKRAPICSTRRLRWSKVFHSFRKRASKAPTVPENVVDYLSVILQNRLMCRFGG